MRIVLVSLVTAVLSLAAARGLAAQAHPSRDQRGLVPELTALLEFLDSAAAEADMDRFLSVFVDGPELAFAMNGRVLTNIAEIRAYHVAALSKLASVRFATRPVRVVRLGPEHAAVTAAGETERVLRTGERGAGRYAVTLVVRRTPRGWRVLQAHESSLPPSARPAAP